MAAPSYTTDLALVANANIATDTGTWDELSGHTSGGAATAEGDYFIQGSQCVSQSTNNKTGTVSGLQYDYGSDITLATNDCFFAWLIYQPANAIATWANGGLRFGVGSTAGNVYYWNALGSDFGRYPYGGWQNIAVDPTFTPDATDGTPAGTYRIFASLPNINTGTSKGNPHAVDAIRWGRGELIIEFGDGTLGYGTFAGIATQNDNTANRWGLLQLQAGQYLWKGLMSFGNATNACDFRDSNRIIAVDRTPRTYAAFNRIEINNASSRVDWTGINITALSPAQLSKGQLEVIDNATVNFDGCVFTDMSTFIFQSNSTLIANTFRRCGQVTQGGATFDTIFFDEPSGTVGLVVDDLSLVTDCDFNSDGTGHAINLGTIAATTSVSWNNNDLGYAATNGSTGNETILVNVAAGQTLTINVGSGYTTPTYYNTGTGTVVVQSSITITFTGIPTGTNARVYIGTANNSTASTLEASEDNIVDGDFSFATANGGSNAYVVFIPPAGGASYKLLEFTPLPIVNSTIPITFAPDRVYST